MSPNPSPKLAYTVFATWAFMALPATLAGAFRAAPGTPSVGLAVHLLGISAVFVGLVAVWPALRTSIRALDPVMLTALQSWRILGMMFLFLMALGDLPVVFAIPAGVGDVLIGLAAPFVAIRMQRGVLSRRAFGWFTALGLADFALAFSFGNYVNLTVGTEAGFASMTALPLVLVPAFFVPAFALMHLAAWIRFSGDAIGVKAHSPSTAPEAG